MCSGRGTCIVGLCDCHPISANSYKKYTGKFCQCNDYTCPFYNNYMCGGMILYVLNKSENGTLLVFGQNGRKAFITSISFL